MDLQAEISNEKNQQMIGQTLKVIIDDSGEKHSVGRTEYDSPEVDNIVNIKFNNKDYLLSCDDGQEEDLKTLTRFLDKKYSALKDKLGNIGENKLLLITSIQVIDEYFDLKKRVQTQKENFENLSKKFKEMRSLAIDYKGGKDKEISNLNSELDKFKKMVDESQGIYEKMLEKTTQSLEEIIKNTESSSKVQ